MNPRLRSALIAASACALTLGAAGCGSSGGSGGGGGAAAKTALAAAKANFDKATSVHFTMVTKSKPSSGDAVLGADGTLTHQPAFQGKVTVLFSGFNADIPVTSVGGKVFAKLPLTTKYSKIDPSEYGAPDPADFADPATGISGLLNKLAGAEKTGQKRDGKSIVTTYAGTLSGDLVAPIIPSADAGSTYDTVVGIDQDGQIATLKVTGKFFAGAGRVTYSLVFDDYGKSVEITAP
ncbi:MAG: LppX_LprAFG lipoprotein [Marmoricola sp.]